MKRMNQADPKPATLKKLSELLAGVDAAQANVRAARDTLALANEHLNVFVMSQPDLAHCVRVNRRALEEAVDGNVKRMPKRALKERMPKRALKERMPKKAVLKEGDTVSAW